MIFFHRLVGDLELDGNGYTISHCRDFVNENYTNTILNNRQIKKLRGHMLHLQKRSK